MGSKRGDNKALFEETERLSERSRYEIFGNIKFSKFWQYVIGELCFFLVVQESRSIEVLNAELVDLREKGLLGGEGTWMRGDSRDDSLSSWRGSTRAGSFLSLIELIFMSVYVISLISRSQKLGLAQGALALVAFSKPFHYAVSMELLLAGFASLLRQLAVSIHDIETNCAFFHSAQSSVHILLP